MSSLVSTQVRSPGIKFAYIAPPRYRLRVKPDELFMPPGLAYRKV
jgi:hypothetical protein